MLHTSFPVWDKTDKIHQNPEHMKYALFKPFCLKLIVQKLVSNTKFLLLLPPLRFLLLKMYIYIIPNIKFFKWTLT